MTLFAIAVVTIVFTVSAFGAPTGDEIDGQKVAGRICMPGASYFDGCNTVTCLPNNAQSRTEMACVQLDSNGQLVPTPELEAPEDFWQKTETPKPSRKCVPGATYHDGCNSVWCGPNNVQMSTRKACVNFDSNGGIVPVPHLEAPEDFWQTTE